jgi:hypothetical protein
MGIIALVLIPLLLIIIACVLPFIAFVWQYNLVFARNTWSKYETANKGKAIVYSVVSFGISFAFSLVVVFFILAIKQSNSFFLVAVEVGFFLIVIFATLIFYIFCNKFFNKYLRETTHIPEINSYHTYSMARKVFQVVMGILLSPVIYGLFILIATSFLKNVIITITAIILAFLVPVVCLRIIKNRFRILFIAQIITNITIIIVLVFYFVFLAGAN